MPARNLLLLILSKENIGMLTFIVEDIYILLIILCHFAGSVSTTASTNNYLLLMLMLINSIYPRANLVTKVTTAAP